MFGSNKGCSKPSFYKSTFNIVNNFVSISTNHTYDLVVHLVRKKAARFQNNRSFSLKHLLNMITCHSWKCISKRNTKVESSIFRPDNIRMDRWVRLHDNDVLRKLSDP